MLTPRHLSFYGRYNFRRQALAEMLVSIGGQTALYGQFILGRKFEHTALDSTVLFACLHLGFFFSPYLAEMMRTRPARPFYLAMFAFGVLPFLAGVFVDGYWGFAPIIIVANFAFIALFVPLRNRLMGSNYHALERGRIYSSFSLLNYGAYFALAYSGALALDSDPERLSWMFPVVGVIAAAGIALFLKIRVRGERRMLEKESEVPTRRPLAVYAELFRLFAREKRFTLYQLGFVLYGFGFMTTVPREVDIVSQTLELKYSIIVLGVLGLSPLARIVIVRFFGRQLDRNGPFFVCAVCFGMLTAYPLCVWGATVYESIALWLLARIVFGLAMAGVDLAWTIGPVLFGNAAKASSLSGAHIFVVAIRASIAPYFGQWLWGLMGTKVFAVSMAFFVISGVFMYWLGRSGPIPAHAAARAA